MSNNVWNQKSVLLFIILIAFKYLKPVLYLIACFHQICFLEITAILLDMKLTLIWNLFLNACTKLMKIFGWNIFNSLMHFTKKFDNKWKLLINNI